MTILGVPEGSGFTIGTSSNIAPTAGIASKMDMSLGKLEGELRKRVADDCRFTQTRTMSSCMIDFLLSHSIHLSLPNQTI